MRTRLAWLVMVSLILGLAAAGSATAHDRTVTLTARLVGAQEVPPADPDGRAKAIVRINVDKGEVCFVVKNFKHTGAPNRGHIHKAPAGVAGPIVVPFFDLQTPASATDPRLDKLENGRLADCVPGDPAILADIVAHPDQYYVNVHNARFPAGSLRCQLER
jgi:hypothetical protein